MKYVLFVCTHNAGRSQMAQAFFERDCTHRLPRRVGRLPAGAQVWPEVVQVMREVGIDLAGNKPKRLSVEMQLHADWAVTMGCGDVCPYVPTRVDDWDIPDPAGKSLEEVREIRDLIEERVKELVQGHIDEIQSDRTSHQWRLAKLLPALIEEFGETRAPELIRGCADRILDEYDDVPIRSHILSLAYRRTRECLRKETCDVLEHGGFVLSAPEERLARAAAHDGCQPSGAPDSSAGSRCRLPGPIPGPPFVPTAATPPHQPI